MALTLVPCRIIVHFMPAEGAAREASPRKELVWALLMDTGMTQRLLTARTDATLRTGAAARAEKVGAGSVVVSNIPPHSVAVGVPARIIRRDINTEGIQEMDQGLEYVMDYVI
ncbi:Serine acetyltransferase [Tetrabaena socialis]|uniref:Serine acetyltransferase n=1 Tax=Tetrabaena socialis TaxID=47790 RepID=A0A2J8A068_9CHLO|nr:Serine acetyltransferase [Tetrabaena socialis]|eukprot:PNH05910.1 Serine acetyltransferase [Tetrabaena socialis]